jgi:hypothetical protein
MGKFADCEATQEIRLPTLFADTRLFKSLVSFHSRWVLIWDSGRPACRRGRLRPPLPGNRPKTQANHSAGRLLI